MVQGRLRGADPARRALWRHVARRRRARRARCDGRRRQSHERFGGATGTLNEFTIAYDEGKIIGVVEGTGGIANHIREIIDFCKKPTRGMVVFDKEPEMLIRKCLEACRPADLKRDD